MSEITDVSVYAHAYVSNIGDWQLLDAGFVYSQNNSSPTVTDNKVSFGYSNTISGNINELKAETSYYIRAYAVNSKGISYSETKQIQTQEYGMERVLLKNLEEEMVVKIIQSLYIPQHS